jgi:hypothetical protein
MDYIQEYKLVIREYDLSPSMQKDFFYKLLRTSSEPLSFYRSKANDVFSFDDAVSIMVQRYNTPERQARVHNYLKRLRFTSFRFDEKFDASSSLTALTSEISKLSPMGSPQYQGEVHAVVHLRNAVLGETWANDVLRAMNPQTISFSELGTNVHRALLLRDELNAIAATHNLGHGGSFGRYHRASPANTLYQNQGTYGKPLTPGSTSSVPKGGTDSAGKRIGANEDGRDGRRRTCFISICKNPDHMLMDKKCDQSDMRNYVEGQVNRNPKTAPSILFAMMDQYADEDTDIEENVIVNELDEEYADEDGSDIEAEVNWNIATERDPDFSRDVDAEDFCSREAEILVFRILFLRLPLPNPDGRFFAICRHVLLQSIVVH